jgi:hypothetical protein
MQAATRIKTISGGGHASGRTAWAASWRAFLAWVSPKPQRALVRAQHRQGLPRRAFSPRPASAVVMLIDTDVRQGSGGMW